MFIEVARVVVVPPMSVCTVTSVSVVTFVAASVVFARAFDSCVDLLVKCVSFAGLLNGIKNTS